MLTSERKQLIIERLRRDGRLVAKDFASELDLSEDTIRKDLRELASEGRLARVHGGALPVSAALPDFSTRKSVATGQKRALGRAGAKLIEPGMTVFIDGGTTNAEVVKALPQDIALTVVTHSPTIVAELERFERVEIVLVGGRIYRHSMVAVGAEASQAIGRIWPDLFLMGVTAASALSGFATGDVEEAAIKRQIAGQARATWVLLTEEKLGARSPVTIMPLASATGVVVDAHAEAALLQPFEEAGLEIRRG